MDKTYTSIVVLCYNGLEETTRPCLESIIANTPAGSYELIVVDNASADGTAAYLETFASGHEHVQLQLNTVNKGYAGGNNDGMRLARGEYIVLLNNDTLVPAGWLESLLRLFGQQADLGLVGPVTNSAGNEQRIELKGLNENNYQALAGAYIERQHGAWFSTDKLGFFCVAMRRTLPEKIGYLDEKFGIGMFEDDDYCIRAKQAGFGLAVVEDCFVYHKGSVSFKKLETSDYIETFNRNRKYLFEKHGIVWTYTDIATGFWNMIHGGLEDISNGKDGTTIERISCRIDGMTSALYQLRDTEQKSVDIGGKPHHEIQLAEKHRQLMEMSDWASGLKQENERLLEEVSGTLSQLSQLSGQVTGLKQENEQLAEDILQVRAELMGMSDWASGLKLDNERLSGEVAATRTELQDMSDWASGLKHEIDDMSASRLYRLFRFLQRRGL